MTKQRIITLCLVLAVMALIFWFSAQPADESSEQSQWVQAIVTAVLTRLGVDCSKLNESSLFTFIIRKLGHFSEFALLGAMLALHLGYGLDWVLGQKGDRRGKPKYLRVLLLSELIGALYACSDEFHQRFVPGRGPAIRDVCIDAAGVLAGTGIMLLILWLFLRKRAKKAGEESVRRGDV